MRTFWKRVLAIGMIVVMQGCEEPPDTASGTKTTSRVNTTGAPLPHSQTE